MKFKLTKRSKIIIGALLGIVLIVGAVTMSRQSNRLEVEYFTVDTGVVEKTITSDGKIKSENMNTVYALTSGKVEKFLVDIGEYVEKGDVIAILDEENIQLQIEAINAQIDTVNYSLKEAAKPADQEAIESLEYSINSAQIQYNRAKENLENSEVLYEEKAISMEQLNQAQDNTVIAENNLLALKNDLILMKKNISSYVKMQYASQIESLKAQKKQLEKTLKDTQITSPMDGVITEKYIETGKVISNGSPIIEIADMNSCYLLADVLESDILKITEGLEVKIDDEQSDQWVKGEVKKIYPKVYTELTELGIKQKKLNVEVHSDQLSKGYLLDQSLDLKFVLEYKEDVLRIPVDSYFEEDDKSYVFVKMDGKAKKQVVEIGVKGEKYVEVVNGVKEKDKVIEILDNNLEDGMGIQ